MTDPACRDPNCCCMPIDEGVYSFGHGYFSCNEDRDPDCWQYSSPCWICAEAHLKQHPNDKVWPKGPVKPREPRKYQINPKGLGPYAGHTQPHLEVRDPTPAERAFLVGLVTCQYMNDVRYQLSHAVDAFLQGDAEDWILIEFWTQDPEALKRWEDWLNANYPQKSREMFQDATVKVVCKG